MLNIIGFMLIILSHEDPLLHFFYFDVLGGIIMFIGVVVTMYRLGTGGCMPYFKMDKKNTPLFEFLYRVGEKRPIFGKRIPGSGFSQVKGLGLIQEIGRLPAPGSVYRHGDKPVQFALQDIGHTPNPKFAGFTSFLSNIGFNNINEVQRVLSGNDPHLMARIWHNINERDNNNGMEKPVDVLVERLQTLTEDDMKKYPEFKPVTDIHSELDDLLKRKKP